jgi:hypothetical protein
LLYVGLLPHAEVPFGFPKKDATAPLGKQQGKKKGLGLYFRADEGSGENLMLARLVVVSAVVILMAGMTSLRRIDAGIGGAPPEGAGWIE